MRYILLIYAEERPGSMTEQEAGAYMGQWGTYTEALQKTGTMLAGEPLQPSTVATTVRQGTQGQPMISDGPFAETKEQLLGYYVVNMDNLDDAVSWSSRMPHMQYGGSVEIRPIMEFDAPPN